MASMSVSTPVADSPSLFRNRTFLTVWFGHTISIMGDGFQSVALGLWVLKTTGSATAMASIMTLRIVVSILLGAVAGTVVDRVDRRRLMISMDLVRVVLLLGVAYIVATPGMPFAALLGLIALTSTAAQFFGPAFQSSLVHIVGKEHLPRASSMLQITNTMAQIVGPLLGGVVVGLYGGPAGLMGNALTFLVGGIAIALAGPFASPRRESGARKSFFGDLAEGLRYMKDRPLIRSLLVLGPAVNFFGNASGLLLPVLAVRVWLVSDQEFGLMQALLPAGFMAGAAVVMVLGKRLKPRGPIILGSMTLVGLLQAVLFMQGTMWAAIAPILVLGFVLALVNVVLQVSMQAEVEPEIQGRVFGTMGSLMAIASPVSMLLTGILADRMDVSVLGVVAGLCCATAPVLVGLFSPGLRRYI